MAEFLALDISRKKLNIHDYHDSTVIHHPTLNHILYYNLRIYALTLGKKKKTHKL